MRQTSTFMKWMVSVFVCLISQNVFAANPVASNVSSSVNEDNTVSITLRATDRDRNDSLTYYMATQPSHGTATLNNRTVTYTPTSNYYGSDSFSFYVKDRANHTSNTATVSITINSVNDAPTATSVSGSTNEDNVVSINLAGNDIDNSSLSYSLTSQPSRGSASINGSTITYSPQANDSGNISFSYIASDGSASSNTATISIDIIPVNDAPAANDTSVSLNEDGAMTVSLQASDVDGDSLNYSISRQPTSGTLSGSAPSFTYTPNANFHGSDQFEFTVTDGQIADQGTISLNIVSINDTPTANSFSTTTINKEPITIELTGNDIDGDSLTASITSVPAHGSLSSITNNQVTYTPSAGFSGTDSFTFSVSDGLATSAPSNIDISVTSNKSGIINLTHTKDINLNQAMGLTSDDGNVVKIQDSCGTNGFLVGAAIMTSTISVHDDSGVLHMVPTSLDDSFIYKRVYCGASNAFVITPSEISKIDLNTLEESQYLNLSGLGEDIYYLSASYLPDQDLLFVNLIESARIFVYDASTMTQVATLSMSRTEFYPMSNGNIVAIDTSGARKLTILDPTTLSTKYSATLPFSSNLVAFDSASNTLYWANTGNQTVRYTTVSTTGQMSPTKSVSGTTITEASSMTMADRALALTCENCYDEGSGKWGGLTLINTNTKSVIGSTSLEFRHDHMNYDPDARQLVICNNEFTSSTIVPIPEDPAEIDMQNLGEVILQQGTGFAWMALDSYGTIHMVSRLGWNVIASINPETEIVSYLDTPQWPLGIAYDQARQQIMHFNHFDNSISKYDVLYDETTSTSLLEENELVDLTGIMTAPENDALGTVAHDSLHNTTYVVVPELNQMIVEKSPTNIQIVNLPDYLGGSGYDTLKSANRLTVNVYEPDQLVFVYALEANTVFVLDGANNFTTLAQLPHTGNSEGELTNPVEIGGDYLYIGRDVYELPNLNFSYRMQKGIKFIASDEDFNLALSWGYSSDQTHQIIYVWSQENGQPLKAQIELTREVGTVPGEFIYDHENGIIYSLHMEQAILSSYKVFD